MNRKTLSAATLAVVAIGAVLAGCGDNTAASNSASSAPSPSAAEQTSDHNQADVSFAQQMIPHHMQAVDMSKMVSGRSSNAKVIDLASRIQKAQGPEIQKMTGWLNTWGAPAPTGMNDSSSMPDHSMPGMSNSPSMPGMMSESDMTKLKAAKGDAFDTMWLQMMIQHHQGAIEMAKTELAQGSSADAKTLAQQIIDAQQSEITAMQGMLK